MSKDMSKDKEITYQEESFSDNSGKGSTEQKFKKIKTKLKKCQQEKEEYLAGWQRSQADFINYKKDWEKKLTQWQKLANEGLIAELLPVLDSFESIDSETKESPKILKGINSIKKQFLEILKKQGLEEIDSVDKKFNPEFHEVVETVRVKKEQKSDIIIEEIQKGYLFNGRVIRTAKVKISK